MKRFEENSFIFFILQNVNFVNCQLQGVLQSKGINGSPMLYIVSFCRGRQFPLRVS